MNKEPLISLKNVGITYDTGSFLHGNKDSFSPLKDINLDIFQGESIAVIGRNGAGKSSLLRILSGVINPDKGSITNNAKTTALLTLNLGFDPQLSGRRNAIMSGMFMGYSKNEMEEKIHDIEVFADIGDFFDKPFKSYSMGMKARLGFSSAINTNAEVLLIDEILAVGDADFRKKSRKIIEQKLSSNTTIILVSHQPKDIKQFCERSIWIENGHVKLSGKSKDVLSEYLASG